MIRISRELAWLPDHASVVQCFLLNNFNFLDYWEFLEINILILVVLIVSQYVEEFLIIEELEIFFNPGIANQ